MDELHRPQIEAREAGRRDILFRAAKHYMDMAYCHAEDRVPNAIAATQRMFNISCQLADSEKRWTTAAMVRGYLVDLGYLTEKGDPTGKAGTNDDLRRDLEARVRGLPGWDSFGDRQDHGAAGKEQGTPGNDAADG
jgi:hypothetical protein